MPTADPPSIDLSCAHCGNSQHYRITPDVALDPAASLPPREIPSIDLRCLRCGASNMYRLVPVPVHADAG